MSHCAAPHKNEGLPRLKRFRLRKPRANQLDEFLTPGAILLVLNYCDQELGACPSHLCISTLYVAKKNGNELLLLQIGQRVRVANNVHVVENNNI